MKKFLVLLSFAVLSFSSVAQETMGETIERALATARCQSLVLAKNLEDQPGCLPRSFRNGQLVTSDYSWWCCGFFPGVLWQLYSDCGDKELLRYARLYTERTEKAKGKTDTHDLGFMLYCGYGQGYNLTGDQQYLDVLKEGVSSLLTRYDPWLGVIKSWDWNPDWKFPVIIDNMMNLEMLCFMSRMTGEQRFADVAKAHANTTMANHFRDDYSSYHLVSYDPATGKACLKQTVQGFADESAWARGQAWGLYGYTMMYRETKDAAYLDMARRIASFMCNHPNMPSDGVPYWDFDADNIPYALRDASAAACMASALIELSTMDKSEDGPVWLEFAKKQIRTLSSAEYLAEPGQQGGFILKHSVGSIPGNSEVDVPLTYADYYFIEALLRLKRL